MIKLNLQLFAKSAAYQVERRKSKAYATGKQIQEEIKKEEEKKPAAPKKHEKGDVVAAVRADEQYEIYRRVEGKELPVIDKNGGIVTRTGRQIIEKFTYNKNVEGWISKAGGKKYIIRRKK